MLSDARRLENGTVLECDLCLVGAGAAGITIARELLGRRGRVLLLEGGGLDLDPETQALYQGHTVGQPYFPLDTCRLRLFGGTTNHWTGRCAPLDPIDFEPRDWVPHSGWPIRRADLDPYYVRAQGVCQLGPFEYRRHFWYEPDEHELPFDPDSLNHIFWHNKPLVFGEAYRAELAAAANLEVLLHANVTAIEANAALSRVEGVEVATLAGQRFTCRARAYVLACGGLENPRLLLASNRQAPAGLGNDHDLVGRFFMEHLEVPVGQAVVAAPDIFSNFYWYQPSATGTHHYLDGITVGVAQQRARDILNVAWRFYADPANDRVTGFAALRRIRGAIRQGTWPAGLAGEVVQVLGDLDDAMAGMLDHLGVISYEPPPAAAILRTISEQAPNPDSRVTLAAERDRLGVPRLTLDWRLSELDRHTVAVATEVLAREFGRSGVGRVRLDDWLINATEGWPATLQGGFHHMGTTRMSADPRQGVVDPDCRVHGLDNLYVAGSSTFPTSGWANPTLTIVALALRLADHLQARYPDLG